MCADKGCFLFPKTDCSKRCGQACCTAEVGTRCLEPSATLLVGHSPASTRTTSCLSQATILSFCASRNLMSLTFPVLRKPAVPRVVCMGAWGVRFATWCTRPLVRTFTWHTVVRLPEIAPDDPGWCLITVDQRTDSIDRSSIVFND